MLDLDEINRTILMLEGRDTTYATCEKLADLYIVRDHITGKQTSQPMSIEVDPSSEFLVAISGKDSMVMWSIMDDLMDTLRASFPRAYSSVMRKIMES